MKVYVVTSQYLNIKAVEKVYLNEQSAIDFCRMMNKKWFGLWNYCSKELEE